MQTYDDIALTEEEKVLIIGIDSQIGVSLREYLLKKNITVYGTTRKNKTSCSNTFYFDLEQPDFSVFSNKFSIVILCAGTTSIEECERDPVRHKKINVTNTQKIIEKFSEEGSFIIYLSSNLVFSGENKFYKFNDKKDPITQYGKFKAEVEDFLINYYNENSCILRLTKVISETTPFIVQWKNNANGGKKIETYSNKFLSPIHMENVVENIFLLINQKKIGIYQFSDAREISYTDYAKEIFKNNQIALSLITEVNDSIPINIRHNSLTTYLPTKEAQYNDVLNAERIKMGLMSGHAYLGDTKRLAFTLSRYKFVSKMFTGFNSVLEVGCADAFGTPIVFNEVRSLVACDFDSMFIDDAKRNHPFKDVINFQTHNMVEKPIGAEFEGVFSLDVLEHINKQDENKFIQNICLSLTKSGSCIIGMPSLESQLYASEISKLGHVNCKKATELKSLLDKYFERVFIFSMNDEVLHTGFHPMSQYLLALCCIPIR